MQTVSIYKDNDLGIFIAKTVLLLVAPSVESLLLFLSICHFSAGFKCDEDKTLTANRQTHLLAHQLLRSQPCSLLRPIPLAYSPRPGNVYLRRP